MLTRGPEGEGAGSDSDPIIDTLTRTEILQDNNKYRNRELCIGKGVS